MSPWERERSSGGGLLVVAVFALILVSGIIATTSYCGWKLCAGKLPCGSEVTR